jgi:hypothetical protein
MARLNRLGLAAAGWSQERPATRRGTNQTYDVAVYRPAADGKYLVQSLRDGVARCRLCGCTEERACPGGCGWVLAPKQMGHLCSACAAFDMRPSGGPEAGIAL